MWFITDVHDVNRVAVLQWKNLKELKEKRTSALSDY